ncbi:Elf4 domain-containing protein [Sporosarcina cyprini]|uniref:Elf4 domain-containing protein n=1 Tax=Sporosarcina cyprini TaxID=2910523 RepID=UPI001EE0228B|nr:Elf4 domain-containing protein [Sporosarcina cyprini]MCG3089729.1 ELF4 family protein [Sporosarcina cyprini]
MVRRQIREVNSNIRAVHKLYERLSVDTSGSREDTRGYLVIRALIPPNRAVTNSRQ